MSDDFTSADDYSIAFCGDEWESTYGHEASEVRLWRADGILVIAAEYRETEPHARGTYELTSSDLNLAGASEEFRNGWRTWQAAFAALADMISSDHSREYRDALLLAIKR